MFDNWGWVEWLILIIDIFSIIVVVWFLRRKVLRKFAEVETRHGFETRRRKVEQKNADE
tara:strand:- start:27571 stop:27747 length:177 start_codon:yes stop_codon:yes gene_type:complete